MGAGKKRPTHPRSDGARYLSLLSKAALIDLLLDAVDLAEGEDWSMAELEASVRPRLAARGDRVPAYTTCFAGCARLHRAGARAPEKGGR